MQQFDKPITLEDVARQAHMTPQAFCRYFKRHTLHTFVSFLNKVRINEACKRLTDGRYDSIATVAYNCGFNSITNFNRVFKTVTGKSPSEYIESYSKMLPSRNRLAGSSVLISPRTILITPDTGPTLLCADRATNFTVTLFFAPNQLLRHRIEDLIKFTLFERPQTLRRDRLSIDLDIEDPAPVIIPPIITDQHIGR